MKKIILLVALSLGFVFSTNAAVIDYPNAKGKIVVADGNVGVFVNGKRTQDCDFTEANELVDDNGDGFSARVYECTSGAVYLVKRYKDMDRTTQIFTYKDFDDTDPTVYIYLYRNGGMLLVNSGLASTIE